MCPTKVVVSCTQYLEVLAPVLPIRDCLVGNEHLSAAR
jgi:hypothetical protein